MSEATSILQDHRKKADQLAEALERRTKNSNGSIAIVKYLQNEELFKGETVAGLENTIGVVDSFLYECYRSPQMMTGNKNNAGTDIVSWGFSYFMCALGRSGAIQEALRSFAAGVEHKELKYIERTPGAVPAREILFNGAQLVYIQDRDLTHLGGQYLTLGFMWLGIEDKESSKDNLQQQTGQNVFSFNKTSYDVAAAK